MRTLLRRRTSRVGFTLAEILIALALMAVLAAVLLPAVAGQIMKGDAGRTLQDLEAIRAGVDQFLADVHRYPQKYTQLSTKIAPGDEDVLGTAYPAGMLSKWTGPYVTKDVNENGVLMTGFGATIQDSLIITANTNAVNYVTVRIFGIDSVGFRRLEDAVDGPIGPLAADWTTATTTGIMQWKDSATTVTKYLATPIQ